MKTFIKVTEIWLPNAQRTQLEFGSGLYGALTEFKAASEQQHFAYDEGLPGKAWACRHPIMLTAFEHSYFKRTAAAKKAGLTCGIAIPIFSGDFLLAVVMFLCGDDEQHAGAIEVWSNQESDDSLSVLDGYYGTLQHFEQLSRQIKLNKGQGIPGQVWAGKMPVLIENIGQPDAFVRGVEAQKAGISTCLGIPIADNGTHTYIMTFLSAKATPLAKRIQIWIPDAQGQYLLCQQGYSKHNNELAQIFETLTVRKGEGALGRVWLTGLPVISGDNDADYNPELDNLSTMLAIPVIAHGHLTAIVAFLF